MRRILKSHSQTKIFERLLALYKHFPFSSSASDSQVARSGKKLNLHRWIPVKYRCTAINVTNNYKISSTAPTTILSLLQFKNLLKGFVTATTMCVCTIHSTISDKSTVCWFSMLPLLSRSREWEKWWLDLLEPVNRESTTIIRLCGLNQLLLLMRREKTSFLLLLPFAIRFFTSLLHTLLRSSPFQINGKSHSASPAVVTVSTDIFPINLSRTALQSSSTLKKYFSDVEID